MVEIRRRPVTVSNNDLLILLFTYAMLTFACASISVYFAMKFKG
jgi:hypothetical protein